MPHLRNMIAVAVPFLLFNAANAFAQTPGMLKWVFPTGDRVKSSPAIGPDGTIYVGSQNRILYALNPDGSEKWTFEVNPLPNSAYVSSAPTVGSDGTIYVGLYSPLGNGGRYLYAINPDGSEKWLDSTASRADSSPALGADGTIYLGTDSGLFAFTPSGTQKWVLPPQAHGGTSSSSSPAIGPDGTIYYGSEDGNLYAVHPDGTPKWAFETGREILSSPAIAADGTIYFGSLDGNVYAIHPDGTLKWTLDTENPVWSSPAIGADGTVYIGTDGPPAKVFAINPDGTEKWAFTGGDYSFRSSPAIGSDGTIYIGSTIYPGYLGSLYAINPDGTQQWVFGTGHYVESSPAIGSDGTIYVGSRDGNLYAVYSSSDGLADTDWPMFHHNIRHTGKVEHEITVVPLTVGEAHSATIFSRRFQHFALDMTAGQSLLVEVVPGAGISSLILDGDLGAPPPYAGASEYTTRTATPRGHYELLISPTEAGSYYFSVFAYDADLGGGDYTITASLTETHLSDVFPRSAGNAGMIHLEVTGLGLAPGMDVELGSGAFPTLTPEEITVSSVTELLARFELTASPIGSYDVTVTWPDSSADTLPGAFEITAGIGPRLEPQLEVPAAIRGGRQYTVWLEYANTGDSDMPAPLFTVAANTPISLDRENVAGESVQVLGIGTSSEPGLLRAGESRRIPIYFTAPPAGAAEFTVYLADDGAVAIHWPAHKDLMRPPGMGPAEWDALWPGLIARLGDTWEEYLIVLRANAGRLKRRGLDVYDVRRLIRLEARAAAGEPIAAISGTLKDADAGLGLSGVAIRVKSLDGTILRQTDTSYAPQGHFLFEDLADATYEILLEGYYFESPETATVSGDDVNGLILYAGEVPADEPEVLEIAGHSPSIARDGDGNLYLAWQDGMDIAWAVDAGDGWTSFGTIPGGQGSRPIIEYDPFCLDGGSSACVFVAWEATQPNGLDDTLRTIAWSVGELLPGGVSWSVPQSLTADDYDDFAVAVLFDNLHSPVVLWLQRDFAVADDTDLYFQAIDLSSAPASRSESAGASAWPALIQASTVCIGSPEPTGRLAKIPQWVPVIGGKYGYRIYGQLCASGTDCAPGVSGSLGAKLHFGEICQGDGTLGVAASWSTDQEDCGYLLNEAGASFGVGADCDIPVYTLPIKLPEDLLKAEILVNLHGSITGSLVWESNFPAWPDAGHIVVTAGGGGKAQLKVAGGFISGEGSLLADVEAEYLPPGSFEPRGYCVTLSGGVGIFWSVGTRTWLKQWGTNCSKTLAAPYSKAFSSGDRSVRERLWLAADEVPIYEQIDDVKTPFIGTGLAYEATPLLGDVSADLYHDGVPAVATSGLGEILAVWTKDLEASSLGAGVWAAAYDGAAWGTPVAITPEVDFTRDPAVAFDSGDVPVAVWASAVNDGLDYDLDTLDDILAAMQETDIVVSRRDGGTWSAPATLATLPGEDHLPVLAAGTGGEMCAAWLNRSETETTLYASFYDGAVWSAPVVVTTAALAEAPALVYRSGQPLVVWAQDGDADPETSDDWQLYTSTWDGASWSSPVPPATDPARKQFETAASPTSRPGGSLLPPPQECCQDREDPQPPEPPEGDTVDQGSVPVIMPIDPNEKVATEGEGTEHAVPAGDRLTYTVYFENQPGATAPAQEVMITDFLSHHLDGTTLRVEEIAFGDVVVANPGGSALFETRVTIPDYRPGDDRSWWVDVSTPFDGVSGRLEPTFRTLDPETGQLPEDPFAGFLPPNDDSHRGEGHVTFSVETRSDLADGTVITNQASIVFDTNAPILTNEVFNTVMDFNRSPEVVNPGGQIDRRDDWASLQIYADDPDDDSLTYSAVGLPPELAIDPLAGSITGWLTVPGVYTVTLTVSDGILPAGTSFTWTVHDPLFADDFETGDASRWSRTTR